MHAVLVVGNGASNVISSLLFPSVAKAVAKLKRVPVAVVNSNGSVQHYGGGDRAGEVETWDGGCALEVFLKAFMILCAIAALGRAAQLMAFCRYWNLSQWRPFRAASLL